MHELVSLPISDLPRHMQQLPVDDRGFVVPWFVQWINGKPEFRVADGSKFRLALRDRLCWVCGVKLGAWLAFALGPMCTITRTTAEPHGHRDCVLWSIKNCPFMNNPRYIRRTDGLPDDTESRGYAIKRNPGVTALWITREYEKFPDQIGRMLIQVGTPESVTWWREGRPATRGEVEESILTGMPALLEMAKVDGAFAVEQLRQQKQFAERFLPDEAGP